MAHRMTAELGSNGALHQQHASNQGPAYASLAQTAAIVIRKANEIGTAGHAAPLANEWQGVFAAARAALKPPFEESQRIAAFGMQVLVDRAGVIAEMDAPARAQSQTLAATVVELLAQRQGSVATALSSLVAGMSVSNALPSLQPFYVCLEALVRCRLASDTGAVVGAPARSYWQIALRQTEDSASARLVLCAGLSGSGKSFVANGIACALGARVVASDNERKRLAGIDLTQPTPAMMSKQVYNGRMTDRVYRLLNGAAETELRAGRTVILDATFLTRERRAAALAVARAAAVPATILWCAVSDAEAAVRLRARASLDWTISDADARIRRLQRNGLQRPRRDEDGASILYVDTGAPPALLFVRLLTRLRRAHDMT